MNGLEEWVFIARKIEKKEKKWGARIWIWKDEAEIKIWEKKGDMKRTLWKWHEADEVEKMCKVVVCGRAALWETFTITL